MNFDKFIFRMKLNYSDSHRRKMISWALKHYYLKEKYKSENFCLPSCDLYDKLYDDFLKKTKQILNFSISKENKKQYWAFISDFKFHPAYWHNHIRTSTINSVYYLKVNKDELGIRFRHNEQECHIVPKNDELLIFPCWLEHFPIPSKTFKRITINMELLCLESVEKIFE
jgi:hypothetical protein